MDRDQDMLRQAAALEALLGARPAGFHPVAAEEFTPPFDGYRADLVTCVWSIH